MTEESRPWTATIEARPVCGQTHPTLDVAATPAARFDRARLLAAA